MKKICYLILFVFTSVVSFSQNLRIGIENGISMPIFSISNDNGFYKQSNFYLAENGTITASYTFNNSVFIKSGLGYYTYSEKFFEKHSLNDNHYNMFVNVKDLYKSLYIPLQIGYKQKLFSEFYLKYTSGVEFNLIFDKQYYAFNEDNLYYLDGNQVDRETMFLVRGIEYNMPYTLNSYKRNFNILFSNQLSLSYEIKKFMYIDLYAEYHAGLFKVVDNTGYIRTIDENNIVREYHPVITSNGSYWRIGLGIGYIFKNKKK